jgi:hypothetical protein
VGSNRRQQGRSTSARGRGRRFRHRSEGTIRFESGRFGDRQIATSCCFACAEFRHSLTPLIDQNSSRDRDRVTLPDAGVEQEDSDPVFRTATKLPFKNLVFWEIVS